MSQPKKFHVKVDSMKMKIMGFNIMPIMVMMMNLMPESMRRSTVTKKVRANHFMMSTINTYQNPFH